MQDFPTLALEVDYQRRHGIIDYNTTGQAITGLSFPSWEEFVDNLTDLPQTDGLIVSPELITSPLPLDEIPGQIDVIRQRIGVVKDISKKQPEATILLGTATNNVRGLRNSLVTLANGGVVDAYHKVTLTPPEGPIFTEGKSSYQFEQTTNYAICSDLFGIFSDALARNRGSEVMLSGFSPKARRLIVSSCWAVPMPYHPEDFDVEESSARQLEKLVAAIFYSFDALDEVVMIDRAIPETSFAPFNAKFIRA